MASKQQEPREANDEQEEQQPEQPQAAAAEELLRRGAWTEDEDTALFDCIAIHGVRIWKALPRAAGLKRTWKSCLLRWMTHLRPGVNPGGLTTHEKRLILHLHSQWGNRWSQIVARLPGRTDNEIRKCIHDHNSHRLRRAPDISLSPTPPMLALPSQLIDREESDDGSQGSQPVKRLRWSSCNDDKQMKMLEEMQNMLQKQDQEMRNMLQKQDQKIESMLQENHYLREQVSSLTADISRLDGYLQQSPALRLLSSDQHCSRPSFQLRFLNSCKNDKYSKHKIEADDKTPLKVAIYDHKNEIITSEPFSSMRVHIVPIQGDFDNDHKGQWTEEYFQSKIVSGRPGKEPLLFGDLYIRLQDGVGYLNTAKFQDNSSFVASKRFKLAVMAADTRISQRIQEGITESFAVKDIRGYSTKKNLYPCPQDPVYKLRKIAKDGDRRKLLEKNGIKTVEDFILSYNRSHEDLRKMLGKISDQDWDMVIDHAQKCNPRPGNQEHRVISRSDGSHYFKGSSSMQPTNSAPQKQLDYQGMHQQSSSTYTELSSGVSLEDVPREQQVGIQVDSLGEQQVGIQVDEDHISGTGNEVLSVSVPLIDSNTSKKEGNSQHVPGYFTTVDDDDFLKNFWKDALTDIPVTEDSGWGGYNSASEQSAGFTPTSGASTPASEAGSCGSLMSYSRSPVRGARGQGCSRLPFSPEGRASSSSYQTHPAPLFGRVDNINNASAELTLEELWRLVDYD